MKTSKSLDLNWNLGMAAANAVLALPCLAARWMAGRQRARCERLAAEIRQTAREREAAERRRKGEW